MPETSLGKSMDKPSFGGSAASTGGEIYTVFDEESDFQVENNQFGQPGQNLWKNLVFKILVFLYPGLKKNL